MTDEEAVRACDWWTTDIAGTRAYGTTTDPMAALHLGGDEYLREGWSNPAKRGWAVTVPRYIPGPEEKVENSVYGLVIAEIQHRAEIQRQKEEKG
jgi:hypothetical protein